MDTKILKVYVIEDDQNRIDEIKVFFSNINSKLKWKNKEEEKKQDNKSYNLSEFLAFNGYNNIKVEVINTKEKVEYKENKYYNFYYDEDADFIIQLTNILKNKEHRLFLLDLALNDEERGDFDKNQVMLVPDTARNILKLLADSDYNELVILNSRLNNLREYWQKLLEISNKGNEKLTVEIMRSVNFSGLTPTSQSEEILLEKIESYLEDKNEEWL